MRVTINTCINDACENQKCQQFSSGDYKEGSLEINRSNKHINIFRRINQGELVQLCVNALE